MKKLLTLAMIAMIAISCNNSETESFSQEKEIKSNYLQSREENQSLELAIEATLEDENLIIFNERNSEVVFKGVLQKKTKAEYASATIQEAENFQVTQILPEYYTEYGDTKIKTVCSVKQGSLTTSIVHVYSPGYSGYHMVTTNAAGISSSSEISLYTPLHCVFLHTSTWFY